MLKEDETTLAQEEAKAEGRKEGRADMLVKIAEILSDEKMGFPGFTGNNLELALNELGLRYGCKRIYENRVSTLTLGFIQDSLVVRSGCQGT